MAKLNQNRFTIISVNSRSEMATHPVPYQIHVDIDTREKYPIPFPSTVLIQDTIYPSRIYRLVVKTHKVTLQAGDYRLSDFPDVCVVERKASQQELMNNLFDLKDSIRQSKAFRKLGAACKHPYLLIESSPTDLLRTKGRSYNLPINPELIFNRLAIITAKHKFNILWLPKAKSRNSRLNTGRTILHLMLGHVICNKYYNVVPEGLEAVSAIDSASPSLLNKNNTHASLAV